MPACTTCTQGYPYITGYIPAVCATPTSSSTSNASNVIYTGPTLPCSGITANDTLQAALAKIDPILCAAGGDYSSFNTFCLAPITTVQQFVEGISAYVCNTTTTFNNFVNTTFSIFQSQVNNALQGITNPSLTCTSAGVTPSDNLNTILLKYCTKFGTIDAFSDISTVNWSLCYSVSPAPTNLTTAFNTIIGQICLLKSIVAAGGTTLPTFNNTGTCLPSPGAADSLVDTVNKIKTRLCQTGTIDNTLISWGCISQPAGAQDLQSTIQNIISQVSVNTKGAITQFSADFTVTNVDNSNLCLGKRIALAVPSSQDRLVAATASDMTPGTLQDKLVAGTNVALDYITTPGKVIINNTGGVGAGGLVLADATDSTPDYLINKIGGGIGASGITLTPSLDTTNALSHQVALQLAVNPVALFTALLQALSTDAGLQAAFCAAIAACPSPCSAPSNVLVTYTAGPASSTSTTSTTTA